MMIKTPDILKEIATLVGFKKDEGSHPYVFAKHEYLLIRNALKKISKKK